MSGIKKCLAVEIHTPSISLHEGREFLPSHRIVHMGTNQKEWVRILLGVATVVFAENCDGRLNHNPKLWEDT